MFNGADALAEFLTGMYNGANPKGSCGWRKHKPCSFFVVLHSPDRQDQEWQVQQAARLARHGGPVPDVLTAMLSLLELMVWSRTGLLLWKEHQVFLNLRFRKEPLQLVSWRPNRLTPIFFCVQRISCKPGKNSDHLMGRTTSSAQKLWFQVAY